MTPEFIQEHYDKIEKARLDLLFEEDAADMDPQGEQFFLLALDALSMALRYLKLAKLQQVRAVANQQLKGR